MAAGFAAVTVDDGVLVRSADVNGFTLTELQFPSGYVQDAFEPEFPYLALVLDGALEKSFPGRTLQLGTVVCAHDSRRRDARGPLRAERRAHRAREDAELDAVAVASSPASSSSTRATFAGWAGGSAAELARLRHRPRRSPPRGWRSSCSQPQAVEARPERPTTKAAGVAGRRPRSCSASGFTSPSLWASSRARSACTRPIWRVPSGPATACPSASTDVSLRVAWAAREIAISDTPLAVIAARAGIRRPEPLHPALQSVHRNDARRATAMRSSQLPPD